MKLTNQISKILVTTACAISFSCATTNVSDADASQKAENTAVESGTESPSTTATNEQKESAEQTSAADEAESAEKNSNYKVFLEKTDGLALEVTEVPKETTKLKPFLTPYAVRITKNANGIPISEVKIDATYPSSRNIETGEIVYATETIQIDAKTETEGTIDFMPPTPQISVNGMVTFSPHFDKDTRDFEKISEEAEKHSATAEFKVRTNLKSAGGVVSILDLDKDGKAQKSGNLKSSSSLLMKIYGAGFRNVGNDDFSKEIAEGDEEKLYKTALAKYKDASFTFLIYGVYKYDAEAASENPTDVNLLGEISCLNLKAGADADKVLFRSTQKASGKNLTEAIEALSKKLSEDIIYGM